MSTAFRLYVDLLNQLREIREEMSGEADATLSAAELPILDEMDRIWANLSEAERDATNAEAWRAWPDEFARGVAMQDVPVWNTKGRRPRELPEVGPCT